MFATTKVCHGLEEPHMAIERQKSTYAEYPIQLVLYTPITRVIDSSHLHGRKGRPNIPDRQVG